MTDFPTWTGPEAVRRLNAKDGNGDYWRWPSNKSHPNIQALQQLMVDLAMPEPVDEAEALWAEIISPRKGAPWDYRATAVRAVPLIREALAKARGERV